MKRYFAALLLTTIILSATAFAKNSHDRHGLVITEKGIAFACQGFAHPDCFRTDEQNLQDAKNYTDSRAETTCHDNGYELAVLIEDYVCLIDKDPGYSITTTCYGVYRCE